MLPAPTGQLMLAQKVMQKTACGQPATLGSSITCIATLSGAGVSNPASSGTFFGFSIYDNSEVNPLLTTSVDGTIAGFYIDATNEVAPFTNPATINGAPAATIAATATVPEPSTAVGLLLGLGVTVLAGVFTPRWKYPA